MINNTLLQNKAFLSFIEFVQPIAIALDIILVFSIVYYILVFTKTSHIFNLLRGLIILLLMYPISQLLGLTTFHWLLEKFAPFAILLLVVLFQPEIRRFLERVGGGVLNPFSIQSDASQINIIKFLLQSVDLLSNKKVGALIVIERNTNLTEFIDTGVTLNAEVSQELLTSLFWPNSPTHDGAVIIRENRISAAGCLLPLSDYPLEDRRLGTRHHAAIGLSELSDALIIVVSEERGVISIAENGVLTQQINKEDLESYLFEAFKEFGTRSGFLSYQSNTKGDKL